MVKHKPLANKSFSGDQRVTNQQKQKQKRESATSGIPQNIKKIYYKM